MAKTKPPKSPSRHKRQRALSLPMYLTRYVPQWAQPDWLEGQRWRRVVDGQPIAQVCRETLISNLIALDWKIEPRDSTMRDELKDEVEYYTKLLEYTGDYDYVEIVEWVCRDLLDLPFGGAVEVGREGDEPDGRVLWIELLDGATLFPTLNFDWPVGQSVNGVPRSVYFPKHAINRVYYSPRTEIERKGWGMAPPEKVYLAIELLRRGDIYYANLLLDTPQAGILDLLDMDKATAEEWVKSFRELLYGIDPFKIPVLYEHTTAAEFIPFGRPPTELMFDKVTMKYAAIVAAGYGMSLSDIGFGSNINGGETLAGSIRQERKTRRTGFARIKKKMTLFFNRLLPPYLRFRFIDLDEELSVAMGRARLASATAFGQLVDTGLLTPQEARLQMIADGLTTISIPETLPEEAQPRPRDNKPPERPSLLGKPVPPSGGGHGEVLPRSKTDGLVDYFDVPDLRLRRMVRLTFAPACEIVRSLGDENTTPDALLHVLRAELGRDGWWEPESFTELAAEWLEDFRSIREECIIKARERAYELGQTGTVDYRVKPDKRAERRFVHALAERMKSLWEQEYPRRLAEALLIGVASVEEREDVEAVIDEITAVARAELGEAKRDIINLLGDVVAETMNQMLEDYDGEK